MTGDLTMHGVTKSIVLPVTLLGEGKDPFGNEKMGLETGLTLNRKDYGLNWNKTLETGGVLVGDDVKIQIAIEANKAKPPQPAPRSRARYSTRVPSPRASGYGAAPVSRGGRSSTPSKLQASERSGIHSRVASGGSRGCGAAPPCLDHGTAYSSRGQRSRLSDTCGGGPAGRSFETASTTSCTREAPR